MSGTRQVTDWLQPERQEFDVQSGQFFSGGCTAMSKSRTSGATIWRRRTNVWHEITRPARGFRRLTSDPQRAAQSPYRGGERKEQPDEGGRRCQNLKLDDEGDQNSGGQEARSEAPRSSHHRP